MGLAIAYLERSCIYLVIALGAKRLGYSEGDPYQRCHRHTRSHIDKRKIFYDWPEHQQGHILASFYAGYVLSQIPGGILALTHGAENVVGVSVLLSSLSCLLIPTALDTNIYFLIAVRFLMGFLQGPLNPALSQNGVNWSPREERSLFNSIVYSGIPLGLLLANVIPSEMLNGGYAVDAIFYTIALFGIIWSVVWLAYVTTSPADNRFISLKEIKFIWRSVAYDSVVKGLSSRLTTFGKTVNFTDINWTPTLMSKHNIIVGLANFGFDWGFNMLSMELPFYAVDVLRMPVPKITVVTAMPWLSMFFGTLLFGSLSQIFLTQKIWKSNDLRKTMGFISMPVFGLCLLVASQEKCASVLSTSVFSMSAFYGGAAASGPWLSPALLSPSHASLVTAIANTLSGISGIIVPLTVLSIAPARERTMSLWVMQFSVATVIMIAFSIPYILYAETEVQDWNDPRPTSDE